MKKKVNDGGGLGSLKDAPPLPGLGKKSDYSPTGSLEHLILLIVFHFSHFLGNNSKLNQIFCNIVLMLCHTKV